MDKIVKVFILQVVLVLVAIGAAFVNWHEQYTILLFLNGVVIAAAIAGIYVLYLVYREGGFGWLALCVLTSWIGIILFLLFGRKKIKAVTGDRNAYPNEKVLNG
jgi:hypothetical protein